MTTSRWAKRRWGKSYPPSPSDPGVPCISSFHWQNLSWGPEQVGLPCLSWDPSKCLCSTPHSTNSQVIPFSGLLVSRSFPEDLKETVTFETPYLPSSRVAWVFMPVWVFWGSLPTPQLTSSDLRLRENCWDLIWALPQQWLRMFREGRFFSAVAYCGRAGFETKRVVL